MLDDPRNAFWDDVDDHRCGRDPRRHHASRRCWKRRDELTRICSPATRDIWQWGKLHQLKLVNPTLATTARRCGSCSTAVATSSAVARRIVNAIALGRVRGRYDVTTVPSMRMVVPLDDLDAARWINLTGASGHAYDDHYTDQTELWADGETLPWVFSA